MKTICKKIPLKDVATFLNGYAFKPSDWSKEGLPIIRIQNLTGTNKEFNYYNGNYNEKYIIENGDILISWSASLGIFLWKNITGILNQHIFKVIFDKDIETDKLYFLHCMKYLIKKIEKNIHGSTMKHITRPEFEKINFPIYDIDIQRKIAKKLIFISEIIDNNKRILVKLMDLSKSLFTTMFGDILNNSLNWRQVKLEDLCSSIVRGPFGSSLKKEFFVKNGYKVYEQKNAINQSADLGEYYINEEKFKELKRFECKTGDIIMSCSGTVGKLFQLPEGSKKGVINQALCKFSLNNKTVSIYFLKCLEKIMENLKLNGSGIKNISSVSYLRKIDISLPPIELQNKFAERIKKIEKLKFTIWKIISKVYKTPKKKGVESN
ncbi:hypothetical protein HMPREF9093_00691 [Fusobacterium sp. oral taxon 370 str. F0437]|uniref:restriction endonuclease subunit S n=1 Tax=Fusobacterium sp. oral taxon 370 TaxID=712288 RepID=UPI000234B031|nr:restriction endonuclease subunit S [Fusobacterium sp. oral taxon 370]EHI79089.1 hypothetical protein HMPREF9093_00691 [Fusobacterium sp. oral taxon 370 str. F0437]